MSTNPPSPSSSPKHESLPRPILDEEWAEQTRNFPGLKRENVYVTSPEFDSSYNCIGWTIGDTTLEYDVEATVKMVEFYRRNGFDEVPVGSEDADVDLMAISNGYFASHATKRYTGPRVVGMPANLWESKLYPGERITHGRYELEGTRYGRIVRSFRRRALAPK